MKIKKSWQGNSKADKLTNGLFIIYLIVLCWILLFKLGVRFSYMENRIVNLIPFREVLLSTGQIDIGESILNIVIFIPLGIYAGLIFKRWTLVNKILLFFLMSLLFEGLQFVIRIGAFDTTDITTNVSGGILGLMIFRSIEKLFNNTIKSQKFINLVSAIGTMLIVSMLLLLKLNMLPIRYQ